MALVEFLSPLGQRVLNVGDRTKLLLQLDIGLIVREFGSPTTVPCRDTLADHLQEMDHILNISIYIALLVAQRTYFV